MATAAAEWNRAASKGRFHGKSAVQRIAPGPYPQMGHVILLGNHQRRQQSVQIVAEGQDHEIRGLRRTISSTALTVGPVRGRGEALSQMAARAAMQQQKVEAAETRADQQRPARQPTRQEPLGVTHAVGESPEGGRAVRDKPEKGQRRGGQRGRASRGRRSRAKLGNGRKQDRHSQNIHDLQRGSGHEHGDQGCPAQQQAVLCGNSAIAGQRRDDNCRKREPGQRLFQRRRNPSQGTGCQPRGQEAQDQDDQRPDGPGPMFRCCIHVWH